MTSLGDLVRERCEQLGLTPTDVSRLGGRAPVTQSRILAGQIPGRGATQCHSKQIR